MLKFLNGKLAKNTEVKEETKQEPVQQTEQAVQTQQVQQPVEQINIKEPVLYYELEVVLKNNEANIKFKIKTEEELDITMTEIVNAIQKKECVEVQNCIINGEEVLFCIYNIKGE